MANTLTPALPTLISNFQSVLREQVGFIMNTTTDFDDKGAAKGTSVNIPIGDASVVSDAVPGIATPTGTNSVVTSLTHVLDKFRKTTFFLTQEEVVSLRENREGFQNSKIMNGFRALINEIEVDIGATAAAASRAVGVAGTTPFGSNHSVLASLGKIFDDNGAQLPGRKLVMDSSAKENLGQLTTLNDASALGSASMVNDGIIGRLNGFDLGYSAGVFGATKGTGGSYVVDNGNIAIGSTALHFDGGTGTFLAGDIIKIESDTNQYVVTSGAAGDGDVDVTIAEPGLVQATVDGKTITIQATSVRNYAFTQDAIAVSVRPPIREDADQATEIILIPDPLTGLTVELAYYPQYLQGLWQMSVLWGITNVHPAKTAILLG